MAVIATTRSGRIRGRDKDGVLLFAGVPYAAPPIAGRRFRAPMPHDDWTGVRDARKFGPAAPQIAEGGMTNPAVRWDEDCLTLNLQTGPGLDTELGVPVPAFYPVIGSDVLPEPPLDAIRETMVFDEISRVLDDPDGEERSAWDGLR